MWQVNSASPVQGGGTRASLRPRGASLGALSLLCVFFNGGCDKKPAEQQEHDSVKTTAESPAQRGADSQTHHEAADAAPVKDARNQNASCLSGTWFADYASFDLEGLLKEAGNAFRVTKQVGTLRCVFHEGEKQLWDCEVLQPIEVEASSTDPGLPLSMKMKMSGVSKMQYELVESQKFKVVDIDMQGFHLAGAVSIAGREMPFPVDKFPRSFGEAGTIWSYACEGDVMHLTGHVPGVKSLHYKMTRTQ